MELSSSGLSKSLVVAIAVQELDRERSAIKIQALARGYRDRRRLRLHQPSLRASEHRSHVITQEVDIRPHVQHSGREAQMISSDKESPTDSIASVGTMAQVEVHTILRRERAVVAIQALVRGAKCRRTFHPLTKAVSSKAQRGNLQGSIV